jgi:hypothetical protein
MVDTTTFITGVAEGAFDKAFEGLKPYWAQEETLIKLGHTLDKILDTEHLVLAELLKANKNGGGGGGGGGVAQSGLTPKEVTDLATEIIGLRKAVKETTAEEKKRAKAVKEEEEERQKTKAMGKSIATTVLGAVIYAGNKIKEAMIQNVQTFDQLAEAGINVVSGFNSASSGFEALQNMAKITGGRFTELADTIVKYNTAVNSFGLARFAKTIGSTKDQLTQFGYGFKEAGELVAVYVDAQKGYADVNSQTQAELEKNLVRFGERVSKLAQATGIARSKLLEEVDAISQSIEANILASKMGADATESTLLFVKSFKDQNLGNAILKMMSDVVKPLNSTFQAFQKVGFGGFAVKYQKFLATLEDVTDPEQKAKMHAEFAEANMNELKAIQARTKMYSEVGMQGADETLKISTGILQSQKNYRAMTEAERKKMSETSGASKGVQNEMERAASQWQQAFAPTIPMLNAFTDVLKFANDKIEEFAALFGNATKAWIGFGVVVASTLLGFGAINGALTKLLSPVAELGVGMVRAASGLLSLKSAAALAAAAYLGWQLGDKIVKPLIDAGVQKVTGDKNDTLGTAIYDYFHKDENKKINEMLAPTPVNKNNSSAVDPSKHKNTNVSVPTPTRVDTGSSATPPPSKTPDATASTTTESSSPSTTTGAAATDINTAVNEQVRILRELLVATVAIKNSNDSVLRYTKMKA